MQLLLELSGFNLVVMRLIISSSVQAVKSKDHGNRRKIVGAFRWLFAGTKHGQLLASSLASIAGSSTVDHRVKLGWCIVVRELVEKEAVLYRSLPNGELLEPCAKHQLGNECYRCWFVRFVAC